MKEYIGLQDDTSSIKWSLFVINVQNNFCEDKRVQGVDYGGGDDEDTVGKGEYKGLVHRSKTTVNQVIGFPDIINTVPNKHTHSPNVPFLG